MKAIKLITLLIITFTIAGLAEVALAKDEVGDVVALRGRTVIERDSNIANAKVKDRVLMQDSVSTLEASRAKLLFIDDSVLNMGERSKVVIKEFLYAKDKGGKSVFNLLDGKMRAVVGKTQFEVQTPTAVAAARGTIILFHVGTYDGKKCSKLICTETDKEVLVSSPNPDIKGQRELKAGFKITLCEGEPLPQPSPASLAETEELLKDTDIEEITLRGPGPGGMRDTSEDIFIPRVDQAPITPKTETAPPAAASATTSSASSSTASSTSTAAASSATTTSCAG